MLVKIDNWIANLERIIFLICGILFLLMMFLGAFDVLGRYLLNKPIRGTMEISSMMMGGVVLLSWGFTQRDNGHVKVDLFLSRYSSRMKILANIITLGLSLALFVLIGYESTFLAIRSYTEHRTLPILGISATPFHSLVPIGAVLMCIEILLQIAAAVTKLRKVSN